jgi:hypothetical protein
MRRLIPTGMAGLIFLTGIVFLMLSASAAARPNSTAGASKLIVAMHDPGCHWFYTSGSPDHRMYSKTVVRHGPVRLLNLDQAALIIKGPGGTKHDRVGATLKLNARGVYRITMVKQAPDDNHLRLTIQ